MKLATLALILTLTLAAGCGGDDDDMPAPEPVRTLPAANPELAAQAEHELKALGGWERWAVRDIEARGTRLTVHTALYPDSEALPAATGICSTLTQPVTESFHASRITVEARDGWILESC